MPDKEEVERVTQALWDVYHLRNECLGNTELKRRIVTLAKALAADDEGASKYGGVRRNVAEAITRAYLNAPLDHL